MRNRFRRSLISLILPLLLAGLVASSAMAQISDELRLALQRPSSTASIDLPTIPFETHAGDSRRLYSDELIEKAEPGLRSILQQSRSSFKRGGSVESGVSPFSVYLRHGEPWVDILIKATTDITSRLEATYGAVAVVNAGGIFTARVPLSRVEHLLSDPDVLFVELSARREALNRSGRIDINADKVHAGDGLPLPLHGEGVIVGVIDSGIDFSHPDFSDTGGSRIQYLYEYTGDGEFEWNKHAIDTDPNSITQRDLDDGMGHGTHVAGTAAGGGRLLEDYSGIAPKSDIIFVKGMVDGGFSDVAVVGGSEYIFSKAAALGKPAVINLSLGSNFGPIDGSSLYEQALSNLTGPGRIIVAAAGNEGFKMIHAGGQLPALQRNVTLFLADNPSVGVLNLWYRPGVISNVAIGALYNDGTELHYLTGTDLVPVGSFMDFTELTYEQLTLGYVGIDAQTTADPRNGDGNVYIEIRGDPDSGVDLREVVWVVFYDSNASGRADMWALRGEFWPAQVGFEGVHEVPGDAHSTIGSPASARSVISVGSYVTTNTWQDLDNQSRQWRNPDPSREPEAFVVPQIGQKSYFSSFGPTRDGRTAPDISAPGELIFSALSSHLTEGQGYERGLVLQGGHYAGQQGTSMASPHVAGVVALLLQADPTLDYEAVLAILQQSARSDVWTGSVPNNSFGAGKVDAYEAVKLALGSTGSPVPSVLRHFDPEASQTLWAIDQAIPIDSGFVFGTNRYFDRAKAVAFSLPDGIPAAGITGVNVWFGYKRSGLSNEPYSIVVLDGNASEGPTGAPLATQEYLLRDVLSDDSFGTTMQPTVHAFSEAVPVGPEFFVGVDFGAYSAGGIGNAAIMASGLVGQRVSEVWEQWDNGSWHNVSDAWHGDAGSGSGTDGWHMWLEVEYGTTVSSPPPDPALPVAFVLGQNYPNPFNPSTTIPYAIPSNGHVEIIVFDMIGRKVARLVEGMMPGGSHEVRFDASGLASGMYLVRMRSGGEVRSQKILLIQ